MNTLDKLAKIEALIARASSEGEHQAAMLAKKRIQQKVNQTPTEYRISTDSPWKKRLFIALCKKFGFSTYRYKGQRYTTARLKISPALMKEVLWPEFEKYAKILEEAASEILDNLISKIHSGDFEETEVAGEVGFEETA